MYGTLETQRDTEMLQVLAVLVEDYLEVTYT